MSYRILFLNWQDIKHPLGGGAEVYHQEIFKRIAAKGHQITFLCSWYSGLQLTVYALFAPEGEIFSTIRRPLHADDCLRLNLMILSLIL